MTEREMIAIIRLHEAGHTWRDISASLNRSVGSCWKSSQNWEETHVLRRPWGRPTRIGDTPAEIVTQATEHDRRSTVVEVATAAAISRETARRIRHQHGYHYYECVAVPRLTADAKRTRIAFAEGQLGNDDHLPIIFTDECMVAQDFDKGGLWRKRGEMLEEGFYERDHHPLSVMVWGAIGVGFHGPLIRCPASVNQDTYREILTQSRIVETLSNRFGRQGFWWQQDNAPPHQPVRRELARTLKVMTWPPYSPDLSPIEQMWAMIKRKLKGQRFANGDSLFQRIAQAWADVSQQEIDNLCSSFRARCHVCAQHGGQSLNGRWTEVHRVHHESGPP
jgi:hypothetical protein